jgi:O-antigen/teichoic acid export membrane protein
VISRNSITINVTEQNELTPATPSMVSRVVTGSVWTLAGNLLPLGLSFIATPIVIRLLGAEGYGVFALIGLLPTYLAFADFGMGMASTKFGSEAFGDNDFEKEAEVVRTTATIAFLISSPIAIALILFSYDIAKLLNVPDRLLGDASLGLKFTCLTFVIGFLNNIFNSPQLARLRMDLNTLVTSAFRLLGTIGVPVALYLGGGIAVAASVLTVTAFLTLIGHIIISGRLNPSLYRLWIAPQSVVGLLKFGGGLALSAIAAVLLVNLEKLVLTKVTSVQTFAYYTVAFTLANMATNFTGAMAQSLMPAFAQLLSPGKSDQLNSLFIKGLRINIFGLLPVVAGLVVVAKPFLTLWAGEDFGRESIWPFYILLFGLIFNLNAYVPGTLLIAAGRSDILAKLYWLELVPFVVVAILLTTYFGASGAAAAWTIRVVTDCFVFFFLAKRLKGMSLKFVAALGPFLIALSILLIPILVSTFRKEFTGWLLVLLVFCTAIYALVIWRTNLYDSEKTMILNKLRSVIRRPLV